MTQLDTVRVMGRQKYLKKQLTDNDSMNSEELPSGNTSWDCQVTDEVTPQMGIRMYRVRWTDSILSEHKISREAIAEWEQQNTNAS